MDVPLSGSSTIAKWLKMGAGHLVALPLLVVGSYAGVFSVTIFLDVLVRTAGMQQEGLFIGTVILGMAAAGLGLGGGLLYYLWTTVWPSTDTPRTELSGSTTLQNIREGFTVDYNLRTWTVTDHTTYPYAGWPTDEWTLRADGEKRMLEYDGTEEGTFWLYEHAQVSDVTVEGESFRRFLEKSSSDAAEAPGTIVYAGSEDNQYVLAEENVRVHHEVRPSDDNPERVNMLVRSRNDRRIMGLCGGLGAYLGVSSSLLRLGVVAGILVGPIAISNVFGFGFEITCVAFVGLIVSYFAVAMALSAPPPESLSAYWVYETEDGRRVTLREWNDRWRARHGREVEPYEFDSVLPPGET